MGQKVNPNGFRVGVIRDWNTRWYASKKEFSDYLVEDRKIRDHLKKVHFTAGVSKIDIERAANKVTVSIYTARPGMLIGKGGVGVDSIRADVSALIGKPVNVNIMEIRNPDANAQLVAENIAAQLEKRISFRRAMKQAMQRSMKAGAKGIKLMCSGRLGGAEIARTEGYHDGSIPLQTMRADIEYGFAEAHTTYGRIGCKVWIYKGEVLSKQKKA
ncbi:MAG: 30S ribosomal protein S3 [Candidatus Pelethousia sp.]|nr:30S ribosomal protein S3 [Candidatus Pelethousia sp.]